MKTHLPRLNELRKRLASAEKKWHSGTRSNASHFTESAPPGDREPNVQAVSGKGISTHENDTSDRDATWEADSVVTIELPEPPIDVPDMKALTSLICDLETRVRDRHAHFPINISSQDRKELEKVFAGPAGLLFGDGRPANPVVPFDSPGYGPTPSASPIASMKAEAGSLVADNGPVQSWGEIPQTFSATVFDRAEESIKYLVLTNTWPKFVRSCGIAAEVDLLAGS
ncbi:hypothetical protein CBS147353_11583 [Aspergillus niger]|nr:hypothetical protein CBS147353_11583 [Aspergillus niger]